MDSGTTDTYMPRSASGAFSRAFREVSGHDYSTRTMNMSPKEFSELPDIVFVFEGGHEERMPWSSYIECTDESVSRPLHPSTSLTAFRSLRRPWPYTTAVK